jgi:hypothetical protein
MTYKRKLGAGSASLNTSPGPSASITAPATPDSSVTSATSNLHGNSSELRRRINRSFPVKYSLAVPSSADVFAQPRLGTMGLISQM